MTALAQALDALVLAGVAAGLDAAVVREEGTRLAAAVAESIRGAGQDWLAATGETGGLEAFFTAASRGRRWRSAPTDQLSALAGAGSSHASAYARALTEVVSAASALGDPDIGGIASASATAAAQLAAVPGPGERPRRGAEQRAPRTASAASLLPGFPRAFPGSTRSLRACVAPSTTARRTRRPPPPRPSPRPKRSRSTRPSPSTTCSPSSTP
ncbi:hypothetical protein [Rathayibacter rathayi]|uniref:hypothetical protein n=1 Tax=Rathayibacter rathayi TaxID=33887 RepID=UPI001FC923E0|nr:hypothetical protein [Rathayibacter rathayi]